MTRMGWLMLKSCFNIAMVDQLQYKNCHLHIGLFGQRLVLPLHRLSTASDESRLVYMTPFSCYYPLEDDANAFKFACRHIRPTSSDPTLNQSKQFAVTGNSLEAIV